MQMRRPAGSSTRADQRGGRTGGLPAGGYTTGGDVHSAVQCQPTSFHFPLGGLPGACLLSPGSPGSGWCPECSARYGSAAPCSGPAAALQRQARRRQRWRTSFLLPWPLWRCSRKSWRPGPAWSLPWRRQRRRRPLGPRRDDLLVVACLHAAAALRFLVVDKGLKLVPPPAGAAFNRGGRCPHVCTDCAALSSLQGASSASKGHLLATLSQSSASAPQPWHCCPQSAPHQT